MLMANRLSFCMDGWIYEGIGHCPNWECPERSQSAPKIAQLLLELKRPNNLRFLVSPVLLREEKEFRLCAYQRY